MRVFIAALAHETNSFSPIATHARSFEAGILFRPRSEPDRDPGRVFVGYSDFVRLATARGHDPALSIAAWAQPSAPTRKADYEALRDEILHDLKVAMPVDMALLMLHGAQMAVGYDDCEGDLITRARAILGEHVPIGVELDLHCNITDAMIDHATVLIACKEYPHTDFPERARELFDIVEAATRGSVRPVMGWSRVPMLARFHTTTEPMRGFVDRIRALEGRDGVLSITLGHGFPWSDMTDTGASVVVVTDGDSAKARSLAERLGREFFELRRTVYDKLLAVETALDGALASGQKCIGAGPAVIADVADNAGGGAPGDSTFLLRALLDRRITASAAFAMLWDPVAVQTAMTAGVGATLAMRIGGKMGPMSGEPLDVVATVTALADAPVQRGLDPLRPEPMGPSAAVRVGNVDIVINTIRQQVFSPDCFAALNIDASTKDVVVVKSSQHFFAQFAPIAREILYCDAPGALHSNLAALPYHKLRRPIWPLDELDYQELVSQGRTISTRT